MSDAIEIKVRSWANVERRGPAVGIPFTEEQWESFCYTSFCDFWEELGKERAPRCLDCGAQLPHHCEGVPGGFGDD